MKRSDLVTALVALNGGKLVGKTRLQKVVYLLDQCGLNSGLDFDYHNFGPFSADLARATDVAKVKKKIREKQKLGYHDVLYSEFTTKEDAPGKVGDLKSSDVQRALEIMEGFSAIQLELAATLAYLKDSGVDEHYLDSTVKKLKPLKAEQPRLERAHELLRELGI